MLSKLLTEKFYNYLERIIHELLNVKKKNKNTVVGILKTVHYLFQQKYTPQDKKIMIIFAFQW